MSDNKPLYDSIIDFMSVAAGEGGAEKKFQNTLKRINRYGVNIETLSPHTEKVGLTFITRPTLNLQKASIVSNRKLHQLDTMDPMDVNFAIRCNLDSYFLEHNLELAERSPIVDPHNPFISYFTNNLVGISGFPDYVLETESTDGGFQSEMQTVAIGSDRNTKSFDLSLTFKEIQGGIIGATIDLWTNFIAEQCKGLFMPYMRYINETRLNYDVSIYRFTFDVSHYKILEMCKVTGCFPKANPDGAKFNINEGEPYISAASKFSVPFQCNVLDKNDPIVAKEFNMTVKKYNGKSRLAKLAPIVPVIENNWRGIPYVIYKEDGPYLEFLGDPKEKNVVEKTKEEFMYYLNQLEKEEKTEKVEEPPVDYENQFGDGDVFMA